MSFRGRAHRFGDDVNTDYIIAAQHKANSLNLDEMARHAFEDIDPGFAQRVSTGDIVVAGKNFGCGSSRETAVHVLISLGVAAVLAPSFARIYFRNAINCGLPVLECDTQEIETDDDLEVFLDQGSVENYTRSNRLPVTPLPAIMQEMLAAGGVARYLALHGDLVLPQDNNPKNIGEPR